VYRGDVAAQRNPIKLATYITMFPQLIAGPIVRYSDIERALGNRTYTFDDAAYGVRRFVIGLSKKVLIANQLGELVEVFRASGDKSVLFFWMYAVAVTLQIYFDFSGYSDMAIGLGRFFGFKFCENFNYPLISKSISEFWRRWHISLGTWFRDYVYIPLGGNRVNKSRWLFNILVVWFLTGFWHGAAWNFIVWGLFFAVLLVGEKFFWGKYISKNDVVSHIYVAFFILISFVIFNTGDMREAGYYLGAMFGMENLPFISGEFIYYFKSYFVLIVIALLGATPCVKSFFNTKCGRVLAVAEPIVLALLLVAVTAFLADGSFNPFLYFRF